MTEQQRSARASPRPHARRSLRAPATCCPTRCASCARSRDRMRADVRAAPATARCTRRRSSTRRCCGAATSAPRAPRYRTFDEQGDVLALRSDMTIPIARVVATRYADAEPPLRFCYFAHAWRAVERGVGEPREFLQGGLELIGVAGARGRGRGGRADDRRARRGRACAGTASGSATASLYRTLLGALDVPEERHMPLLERLSRRDLVGLELRVDELGLARRRARAARAAARAARRARGARRAPTAPVRRGACEGLRALHELLSRARRGRPRDLRPRARARARLLHGRGVRGLRPGRGLRARRRRPLRRADRALRPRRCPPAAWRSTCSACTWPRRPRRRSR